MVPKPTLPYATDALEPHISKETLEYHFGKHHLGYANKLAAAIEGTEFEDAPLVEIIRGSTGGLYNNAAQVANHSFYWSCLSPQGGGAPTGELAALIDQAFGSFDAFKEAFAKTALGTFGSGWAWLVQQTDGTLALQSTSNAATPIGSQSRPLLTCDVWEHAYYVDYRNARGTYVEAFWALVNWEFVSSQLAK